MDIVISPIQTNLFRAFAQSPSSSDKKIIDQTSQQVQLQEIINENKALQDQFSSSAVPPTQLLPAKIIGMPRFIPGISSPETLILDKGSEQRIKKGMAVVIKNILLGQVTLVRANKSVVTLVTNAAISLTAKTQRTNSLGIVRGMNGGKLALQNVVLADTLMKNDTVVTKGNVDENGIGIPPDLLLGTITSIDKNPSALFQTAALKMPINVAKLDEVFVLVKP